MIGENLIEKEVFCDALGTEKMLVQNLSDGF